jgi:hypothetical protein
LSEAELQALWYFVPLRQMFLLGSALRNAHRHGIGWLLGGFFDHYVGFIKAWLAGEVL